MNHTIYRKTRFSDASSSLSRVFGHQDTETIPHSLTLSIQKKDMNYYNNHKMEIKLVNIKDKQHTPTVKMATVINFNKNQHNQDLTQEYT